MAKLADAEILDLIYGAVVQPNQWATVVDALVASCGAQSAWLSRLSPGRGEGAGIVFNIDQEFQDSYFAHYNQIDPISNVPDGLTGVPSVMTDEFRIRKPDLLKTEFYNDFMKPLGSHSIAILRLGALKDEICSLNLNRDESSGPFAQGEIAYLWTLQEHLARAFRLTQSTCELRPESLQSEWAYADVDQPVFVLDQLGRLRLLNGAAEIFVASGLGVSLVNSRLTASDPETARRLEASIAIAASGDSSVRKGDRLTVRSRPGWRPLELSIVPLRASELSVFDARRLVVVFIKQPERIGGNPLETFAKAYRLTASELRLAVALNEGQPLRVAAETFGVSYHTVRAQLSSIFAKTGVGRQIDLLRLMPSGLANSTTEAPS